MKRFAFIAQHCELLRSRTCIDLSEGCTTRKGCEGGPSSEGWQWPSAFLGTHCILHGVQRCNHVSDNGRCE